MQYIINFCLKLELQSPLPCPIEHAGRHKKMENLSASPKRGISQFNVNLIGWQKENNNNISFEVQV